MAVKTFTTGEVLTAADTNTYLNNGGLVFVKQVTVGTGVASVQVTDAFSATYDNYRIIYTGGIGSAAAMLRLQYGSTSTAYYGSFTGASFSASTFYGQNDNNATLHNYVGWQNTTEAIAVIDCHRPFANDWTHTFAQNVFITAGNAFGTYQGALQTAASVTSFTLSPGGGATFTGGTITVYGYRLG